MKRKRRGSSSTPVTLHISRRLVAAATVALLPEKLSPEPIYEPLKGIFIDGDRVIGCNKNMMTVAHDRWKEINEKGEMGKMPKGHSSLTISPEVRRALFRKASGDRIKIMLSRKEAMWYFENGEVLTVSKMATDHPFPVYQQVIRDNIDLTNDTASKKPLFPLIGFGKSYLHIMDTLKALDSGKPTDDTWGVVFYGFGFPVEGAFVRYVLDRRVSHDIFSVVMGFRTEDGAVPLSYSPSVVDILPGFMLKRADGER